MAPHDPHPRDPSPRLVDAGGRRPDRGARRSTTLRLEPSASAAATVRVELRRLLSGQLAARLDDAELAATELVTNAVLHGREPIVVVIAIDQDTLRVEVSDASPVSPSFSLFDPTAVTGRGLLLVAGVADRWGVDPSAEGKTVWLEIGAAAPSSAEEADVTALLESWGDELVMDPALEQVRVVLTDLDTALLARAEAHVDGMLRELALVGHSESGLGELQEAAERVTSAAAGFEGVRAELKRQLALAVSRGQPQLDVELRIMRSDAELVRDYHQACEAADRICREGALLVEAPEPDLVSLRRDYLRRILAQLGS